MHSLASRVPLRLAVVSTALALSAWLSACGDPDDGTGPTPEDHGSFTATIREEGANTQIGGNAVFTTSTDNSGGIHFAIFLWRGNIAGTSYDIVTLYRDNLDAPAAGTYTIFDAAAAAPTEDDFRAEYSYAGSAIFATYLSVSGVFTVEAATAEEIRGSFTFGADLDESVSVGAPNASLEVTGSFRAVPGSL